jgi:hypothetical protein
VSDPEPPVRATDIWLWGIEELLKLGKDGHAMFRAGAGVGFTFARHSDCAASELESLLGVALRMVATVKMGGIEPPSDACPANHDSKAGLRAQPISICCQHPIQQYRADFVIWSKETVAVELDGHDYHERTKEQAQRDKARDRLFQQLGFKVFRYTGSEVWRDPLKCALEAVSFAIGG